MTIVLTGGGSGGHITPILAVAAELKKLRPDISLVYIGQRGDALGDIPASDSNIDVSYTVRAGKFRRYHGEGFKQLLDVPTIYKNTRDLVYVLRGFIESRRLLKNLKPDIIFVKGGFVGVPVGLAAASRHIPYITHDSDAIPGLANRIISRWAKLHAVALPKEIYNYPSDRTVTTGIPLAADFKHVSDSQMERYRAELKIPNASKLLFVIGGGLGSDRVNRAVAESIPHLLHEFKNLRVIHGVGRANEDLMKKLYKYDLSESDVERVEVFGYRSDIYRYSGAADVIITRAGATNLAEFALQAKACVVIPSPFLTGGHQLKNAAYLEDQGAAVVLEENEVRADSNRLTKQVSELLHDEARRKELGKALNTFAQPDATSKIAQLILDQLPT